MLHHEINVDFCLTIQNRLYIMHSRLSVVCCIAAIEVGPMAPAKPVRKLFKIGEVAEYGGLSRQTVNYYTALGLLHEVGRTKGGHRLYDERTFERIERLRQLKADHTLREIADILRSEYKQPQQENHADGTDG